MEKKHIKTIYHYCSLDTFLSILQNNTIRFSDIIKSNDTLETKALVELIKKATKSLCEKDDFDNFASIMEGVNNSRVAFNHYIDILFQKVLEYRDLTTYVFCFSEDNDLLSQWYEYADNGQGVAIGFNLDTLNEICTYSSKFIKLNKVTYINRITKSLRKQIEDYATDFYSDIERLIVNNMLDTIFKEDIFFWLSKVRTQCLMSDSVFFKNYKFSAEKEWRMSIFDESMVKSECEWGNAYNWDNSDNKSTDHFEELVPKALQFKSIGNDIISYMDLNFSRFKDRIINDIVIGPNCKLTQADVYQIMLHFGFNIFEFTNYEDKVFYSKCPYKTKSLK